MIEWEDSEGNKYIQEDDGVIFQIIDKERIPVRIKDGKLVPVRNPSTKKEDTTDG